MQAVEARIQSHSFDARASAVPVLLFNSLSCFVFGVFFLFSPSFLISETEALGKIGKSALSGSQVAVKACSSSIIGGSFDRICTVCTLYLLRSTGIEGKNVCMDPTVFRV